jgi:hypothetical protein
VNTCTEARVHFLSSCLVSRTTERISIKLGIEGLHEIFPGKFFVSVQYQRYFKWISNRTSSIVSGTAECVTDLYMKSTASVSDILLCGEYLRKNKVNLLSIKDYSQNSDTTAPSGSSRSSRSVRKILDTPSCMNKSCHGKLSLGGHITPPCKSRSR